MKTTRIKQQRRWLAVVCGCLMLTGLVGCTDGFDTLEPQGKMTLRLVAASLDEQPNAAPLSRSLVSYADTKAVNDNVQEDQLSHLWVLQFNGKADNAALVSRQSYSGGTLVPNNQILTDLKTGANQQLVFVANAPDLIETATISTLADFKKLFQTVASEETIFDSGTRTIPMVGYWYGKIEGNEEGKSPISATIQMERVVAKISLTVKTMIADGEIFRISAVSLHNVPGKIYPDKPTTATYPVVADVTHANYGENRRTSEKTLSTVWYMPENCRGTGTAILSAEKNAANLNAVIAGSGDAATWVEIIGDYTIGNETYAATYINYLGGNSTTDYNIRRNSHYDVTITIRGRNTSDTRVKLYGDAATMVINPDDADNNPNTLPILSAVRDIRQVTKTQVKATSTLTVDGKAAACGFLYSESASTDAALREDNKDVQSVYYAPGTSGVSPGDFTYILNNLKNGATYYVRAYATITINDKTQTSYGPITSFKTLSVEPAANCFMVEPGKSVMFETKDATDIIQTVDAVSLKWQSKDDGTATGQLPVTAGNLFYDAENKVVIVHTNPAARAGNVLLSGTKSGKDVWFWHLWVTPYNPNNYTISGENKYIEVKQGRIMTFGPKYVAAVGAKGMMDRDLGSQSTTTLMNAAQVSSSKDLLIGTYYYPDYNRPFQPVKRDGSDYVPIYDISGTLITDYRFTAPSSLPEYNWRTAGNPCPNGWKVPESEAVFEDLFNFGVLSLNFDAANYKGWSYIQGGVNAYFLLSGYVGFDIGVFGKISYTGIATKIVVNNSGFKSHIAFCYDNGTQFKLRYINLGITAARPIRCIQK